MKKTIRIMVTVIAIILATSTIASAKANDKALCKEYVKKHYKGYTIKYVKSENLSDKTITTRKGKKIVLIEIVTSKSHGKHGYTKQGYYIRYNCKVKKGKSVKSYCIFNPKTNYIDDTVAVIDNGKIRN